MNGPVSWFWRIRINTLAVGPVYLHVVVPGTLDNEPLQVVMVGEVGQLQQPGHGQGLVHLGNLTHRTHK